MDKILLQFLRGDLSSHLIAFVLKGTVQDDGDETIILCHSYLVVVLYVSSSE